MGLPRHLAARLRAGAAPADPRPGGRRGFTLVELAVVLVIMGLIGWFFYGSIFNLSHKEKSGQTDRDLRTVESAIKGLVAADKALPSMRSRGSVAAYPAAGLVPAGVTPTRDAWDQDILYFVAPELAGAAPLKHVPATSLRVRVYADVGSGGAFPAGDATLEREVANVAFVLLCRGPNLQGQATVTVSGGVTAINLLKAGGPMRDGAGLEFDDVFRFVSLAQLAALAGS